jgi:hypothetical protein
MRTRQLTNNRRQQVEHQHALRRGLGFWELTFEGRQSIFKHEQGTLYVACLLLDPPSEPIHAVALALKAKEMGGQGRETCSDYRLLGTCPAAVQGSADITSLYAARFGVPPAGKKVYIQVNQAVEGWESLPRTFWGIVPTVP